MANIMINNYCNLNCEYCFVDNSVKEKPQSISLYDFQKIILFLTKGQREIVRVGVIGGEPTLHPEFREIIKNITTNPQARAFIFTNGILLDKYYDVFSDPSVRFLLNLNNPTLIGKEKYQKIINNLDCFVEKNSGTEEKMTIGVNIYGKEKKYDYIIDAIKRYQLRKVRIGITIPINSRKNKIDHLDYFLQLKPTLLNFLEKLRENNIMPEYDCNGFPVCLLEKEEKAWLQEFWELEKGDYCNILDGPNCKPVVDILPDLTAVRCFGLLNEIRVPIFNFDNIGALIRYFESVYDSFSYQTMASEKCKECSLPDRKECTGGCLLFKIEKMKKAKEDIRNIE